MSEVETTEPAAESAEQLMREELARGDRAAAAARPLLRLLLAGEAIVPDDEIVAHARGALLDVARQLLEAQAAAARQSDVVAGFVGGRHEAIAASLSDDPVFLAHVEALAVEAQAAERLRWRSDVDPVLTPLVQDAVADADAERAGLAMAVLAAQTRFFQYHRRMELPLRDLPGDLFHRALLALRAHAGEHERASESAERRLRNDYDESAGRLALIARLIVGIGERAGQALEVERAGVSIFATELAIASGQERDQALLALGGGQSARLSLSLRAAGLGLQAAAAQLAHLQPDVVISGEFDRIDPEIASAMLAPAQLGAEA